jgi:hypothetical protein
LVFDQGAASVGAVNGSFTVPMNAQAGLSRVRVQMAYQGFGANALPGTCGTFQSGETEDYCVTVRASNVSLENIENLNFSIYPNPTSGALMVKLNSVDDIEIRVLTLSGQIVSIAQLNDGSLTLDLSNLSDGLYMVHAVTKTGVVLQAQKLIVAKQ